MYHLAERPRRILLIIIFSQFAGTSLWFAGNAVLNDLQIHFNLGIDSLGYITSAVQLGFIIGTLCFSIFTVSDRFSPRVIFFVCSVLGGFSNLSILFFAGGLNSLMVLRFITGFLLAGIYPVGMKISADWYREDLGKAIGYLVGALVLGTAFPHLLKSIGQVLSWQQVIVSVSVTSVIGGVLILFFVPDGPYLTKGGKFKLNSVVKVFGSKDFRSAAFGYFGHMWELYTFWAFVPFILTAYMTVNTTAFFDVSFWSFVIIGAGSLGCITGGIISRKTGSARVAFFQLSASGICCLVSPLFFLTSIPVFILFLIFWGIMVVGDSPQFSALTAKTAPKELVGTALTIVTSIGFFITIFSIELTSKLSQVLDPGYIFLILIIGPMLGLKSMKRLLVSY